MFRASRVILSLLVSGLIAQAAEAGDWSNGRLHPDTPFPEQSTDIAVGIDGLPFAVWDYAEIWWARWEEECDCWSTPATVNSLNGVPDEYPRISIGSDGIPWVVWSQYVPPQTTWALLAARYEGGAWTKPDTVMIPSGGNDIFDLFAISGQDAWVASEGPASSGQDIFVRRYRNGRWIHAGQLSGGAYSDHTPTIQVDAQSTPWVTWFYLEPNRTIPLVARFTNGQWLTEGMPLDGASPVLAAIGKKVFLVWSTWDEAGHGSNLAYRIWSQGAWGPVGYVNEPDSVGTIENTPSISASPDERGPVVVWSAGPVLQPDLRDIVFSKWTGSGWSPEEIISIPDSVELAADTYPQVALASDGHAWVSWRRLGPWPEQPDTDIWYAKGQVYSTMASVAADGNAETLPAVSMITSPNPSRGACTASLVVSKEGEYEIAVGSPEGRIVDIVRLGVLKPGIYAGPRAFRWPQGNLEEVRSGVFFLTLRLAGRETPIATSKVVLLR